MAHNLKANKDNAIAFYKTAYLGDPESAVGQYVGDEYIQHNPLVGNGKSAFIDYFTEMAKEYPDKTIKFVRAVAEDDLVPYTRTRYGQATKRTSPWIFFASTNTVKLLSIGMPFKTYLQNPRMVILCISDAEKRE